MDKRLTADASAGRKHEALGQRFEQIREICARCDYELDIGERSDRESWMASPR
jgi:hypothetical protein